MATLTNAQAIKEIRGIAKKAGLTFKVQPGAKLENASMYMFIDRKTGKRAMTNCALFAAYNDCMSDYVSSYNKETGCFDGLNS